MKKILLLQCLCFTVFYMYSQEETETTNNKGLSFFMQPMEKEGWGITFNRGNGTFYGGDVFFYAKENNRLINGFKLKLLTNEDPKGEDIESLSADLNQDIIAQKTKRSSFLLGLGHYFKYFNILGLIGLHNHYDYENRIRADDGEGGILISSGGFINPGEAYNLRNDSKNGIDLGLEIGVSYKIVHAGLFVTARTGFGWQVGLMFQSKK